VSCVTTYDICFFQHLYSFIRFVTFKATESSDFFSLSNSIERMELVCSVSKMLCVSIVSVLSVRLYARLYVIIQVVILTVNT
jgi:hypothetical protein